MALGGMLLGNIIGKSGTNNFTFLVKTDAKKFMYVKVLHKELGSGNRFFAIINIYKGILHFYAKHKNYIQYVMAKTLLRAKAKIATIIGLLTGNSALVKMYSSAIKF